MVRWEDESSTSPNSVATVNPDPTDPTDQIDDAQAALAEARQRIGDRKSTRLNSSHVKRSRMPSSA